MQREQLTQIAALFKTLSEPTRLELLHALQSGEHAVSDLMVTLSAKQANVSKQLGILKSHGLVQSRRQGTTIFYSIADPMIFELCKLVCGKFKREAARTLKAFGSTKAKPKRR